VALKVIVPEPHVSEVSGPAFTRHAFLNALGWKVRIQVSEHPLALVVISWILTEEPAPTPQAPAVNVIALVPCPEVIIHPDGRGVPDSDTGKKDHE